MKNIRFVYAYEDDRRELKSWREEEGCIVGFDLSDERVKTFRKDRILRYLDGTESLLVDPYTGPPICQDDDVDPPAHIIFTGFPKAQRAELEALATKAGMRVCATVTQDCAYLVAGPNAGPTKLETAESMGALILDGEQFLTMLETGEISDDEDDELVELDNELAEFDNPEDSEFHREYPDMFARMCTGFLDSGELDTFFLALRSMINAYGGVDVVAQQAQLDGKSLRRDLWIKSDPHLSTLLAVLGEIGLRLEVKPIQTVE